MVNPFLCFLDNREPSLGICVSALDNCLPIGRNLCHSCSQNGRATRIADNAGNCIHHLNSFYLNDFDAGLSRARCPGKNHA